MKDCIFKEIIAGNIKYKIRIALIGFVLIAFFNIVMLFMVDK